MDNIATIERLINEAQAIKNAVSLEFNTEIDQEYSRNTKNVFANIKSTYHLTETFQIKYNDWKASSERFVYQLRDMVSLEKLRNVIDDIDNLFKNGLNDYVPIIKEDGFNLVDHYKESSVSSINYRFDYAIELLNRLKNICEVELSNRVFVVHGHSELLIAQTESFLQKLGFEPIILRNLANQGKTIIEKLESNTDVPFAIVLYTSCDQGRLNDESKPLKPRARQNVVFEHGYLNAKLGRNRVCALVEEGVEYPGDLSGVVYIPIDPNGAWKIKVANEMKAAGLEVDLNKL